MVRVDTNVDHWKRGVLLGVFGAVILHQKAEAPGPHHYAIYVEKVFSFFSNTIILSSIQ